MAKPQKETRAEKARRLTRALNDYTNRIREARMRTPRTLSVVSWNGYHTVRDAGMKILIYAPSLPQLINKLEEHLNIMQEVFHE